MNEYIWDNLDSKIDEREKMDRLIDAILASGMTVEEIAEKLGIEII